MHNKTQLLGPWKNPGAFLLQMPSVKKEDFLKNVFHFFEPQH